MTDLDRLGNAIIGGELVLEKDSYRDALIVVLGSRCSCRQPTCWHHGTCRVSDKRCLQIDHVNGDGNVDRRKFSSDKLMFRYYLENFGEAGHRVQLLCANCNWVKMLQNREGRQMHQQEYKELVEKIERLPDYAVLAASFREVATAIVKVGELDLLSELMRRGLAESTSHPLSYYLSRNWTQQKYYNNDVASLIGFLAEKKLMLESTVDRLSVRSRSLSVGTDVVKIPENTKTKSAPKTRKPS